MIRSIWFVLFVGLVTCTTKLWKRKKPAYWEFPEVNITDRPDISGEYCKSVDMAELGENITSIITQPVRGQADPLLKMIVTYVLTLHRFIRKCNTTDDIAIGMAKDLVKNKRPKFMNMEIDLPELNKRVGFDKYELQHFNWVLEDIQKSWVKLKNDLFGKDSEL